MALRRSNRGRPSGRRRAAWRSTGARRQSRARRIVVVAAVAAVALFVADLAYVAVGLRSRLTAAADRLDAMRSDLESGRLGPARASLASASGDAEAAEDLVGHPAVAVLGAIPVVGAEADTVRAVVRAADLVIRAADPALDAASILDYRNGSVGSGVYADGRINLDALARAEPLIGEALEFLQEAASAVNQTSERSVVPPLDSAVERTRRRVGDALDTVTNAMSLLSVLPRLTGGESPRQYLLAFQALGEARATGGVAGLYGVLEARNGKLRLGEIAPFSRIKFQKVAADLVPSWYRQTYGIQGALKDWRQANLSPNFPVVARVMLEMYRQGFGRELDGVIAVDAVSLSMLMQGTGSFDVPGFDKTITPDNVVKVLSRDAYVGFPDRREQNVFLASLVRAFWRRIEQGSLEIQPFARGVGEAVATQHLKVFIADEQDRSDLEQLNADGSLDSFGPNVQAVFNNNYAVNKVDYYLRREIQTWIEVFGGGDLRVTTRVTLKNEAPAGEPSHLLGGLDTKLSPGTNRMTLNFLLPEGAKSSGLRVEGKEDVSISYRDSGRPIVWDVITLEPGEQVTANLTYVVRDGASLRSDGGELSFVFLPQPALNVDDFAVRVRAPGYVLSRGTQQSRHEYVLEQDLDRPLRLTLGLEAT